MLEQLYLENCDEAFVEIKTGMYGKFIVYVIEKYHDMAFREKLEKSNI